jgi:hypothetical protein
MSGSTTKLFWGQFHHHVDHDHHNLSCKCVLVVVTTASKPCPEPLQRIIGGAFLDEADFFGGVMDNFATMQQFIGAT